MLNFKNNIRTFSLPLLMLMAYQSSLAGSYKALLEAKNTQSSTLSPVPKEIPYPHLVTIQEMNEEDGEAIQYTGSYRVDPFASIGRRVTFFDTNYNFSPDTLEEIKFLNEEKTDVQIAEDFWCPSPKDNDFNEILAANDTQILQETNELVVLKVGTKTMLKTIFSEDEDDMPRKVRKRMNVKLTLSKPDLSIQNIQIELSKPTKIKIVAKIQKFKINMKCQIAPNGIPYISETKTDIVGKVLGNEFRSKATTSISQLELRY